MRSASHVAEWGFIKCQVDYVESPQTSGATREEIQESEVWFSKAFSLSWPD